MNQRGLSTIAIVGIAIGAIVLISIISLFAFGGSPNSNNPSSGGVPGSSDTLDEVAVMYDTMRGGVPATVTFYKQDMNYREDVTTQFPSGAVQTRMYYVSGAMNSCSLTNGAWSCRNIGSNNIIPYVMYILPNIPTKNNPYFTFEESKTVAGESVDCYKIQTEKMCVTKQGLVLERSGNTASSFTATSIRSVSASDFVLP